MMQMWLHALTRKSLPGRRLQTVSRPGRPRSVCPRLEVLEDRTLLATAVLEPPALLAAAPASGVAVLASDEVEMSSVSPASVTPGADPSLVSRPGLQRLLEDIQNLGTHISDSPEPATLDPRVALHGLFDATTASTITDQIFSTFTGSPGASAMTPAPGTAGVLLFFRAGGANGLYARPISPVSGAGGGGNEGWQAFQADVNAPGRTSSAGSVGRPDKSLVQPGGDRNIGETAGPVQRASARISGIARQVGAHRVAGTSNGQPTPDNSNSASSKTNELASRSTQAGMSKSPAAGTEIERLYADLPDGHLLQRFVAHREQMAFTALVARYEGFVLGICQRVLGDSHAAMDAFQATFLLLAQKADMLDKKGSLAGWLWKVAYRLALRLRAAAARQRRCEREAINHRPASEASQHPAAIEDQEMLGALKEELQLLPEKYRVPLVLCYFDGQTHSEAAQAIGLPRGSMAKRLGEALRCLRQRMSDRGFMG
jgi:RNA polymerase sigma factor (sigma-70 family)